jgi:hypothetical protein
MTAPGGPDPDCPDCDGRGWIKDGTSQHGLLCMTCADDTTRKMAGMPPAPRRDAAPQKNMTSGKKGARAKDGKALPPVGMNSVFYSTGIRPRGGGITRGR